MKLITNAGKSRFLLLSAIAAVCLISVVSTPAHAQGFSISITANETGKGSLTNTAGFNSPLPFSFVADPGPGGLASVANYGLLSPPGLVGGDLRLTELSGADTVISDVLRFAPNTGGGSVFFYSDLLGGADSTVDKGLPLGASTNLITLPEISLGALGLGVVYTPTSGQPGFVAGAGGPVTYTFISQSAVPEPSTVLMLLTGLLVILVSTHLNRRVKA